MDCEHCGKEASQAVRLKKNTGGLFDTIKDIPIEMSYKCKYCEGHFCEEHRLPENHDCIGLKLWKAQRQKKIFKSHPIKHEDNTRWWKKDERTETAKKTIKFQEYLIIEKKTRFLDVVKRASEAIGVLTPHVNFDGCSSFDGENAHIHIERNTICVSERYLERAIYEDIEDTAIHEVAHLIDDTHNFSFRKLQQLVKAKSWRPP